MSLQKGLVGHWTLDSKDTSNGTAYDSSAYDRNATLSGNEIQDQAGQVGESYQFPGTSPQEAVIDISDITWTGSHTLSVWVYYDTDSSGGSGNLGNVSLGDHTFNGPCLFADLDNNTQRFWDENSDDNINLNTDINKGEWIHLIGRKDGDAVTLWINGVQQAFSTLSTSASSNSTTFYIGGNDGQSSMKGRVDDARLYNRALSESEISALYNMRSQRQHNSKTTLVESFESNSFDDRWSISNATISSSRQFSGTYSFGSWNEGGVEATWTLQPNGGERIDSFEYIWKEDNLQTGHVVILYDKNGNEIQESGTENPQWYLNNGSGGRFQEYGGDNYNAWTKFQFEFNWGSGNYDYRLEDLQSGTVRTGTTPLDTNAPVNEIRFTGAGYGTADYCRFDDIRINNTTI